MFSKRPPLVRIADEFKRTVVARALDETDGSWVEAARRLGMHRSNLHHKAQRLGVRTASSPARTPDRPGVE